MCYVYPYMLYIFLARFASQLSVSKAQQVANNQNAVKLITRTKRYGLFIAGNGPLSIVGPCNGLRITSCAKISVGL